MNRIIKKTLWSLLLIIGLTVLGLTVWIGPMVYRALVGFHHYESVPPVLPDNLNDKAVLIFSKTNGFRDDEQINAANTALVDIAQRQGWSSYVTENAALFNPEQLQRFKVVVWNSVSGDVLTVAQRQAFRTWLEQGGGFVGLHGAGGDFRYAWNWYSADLIGARFIGHTLNPHIQQATLAVEDTTHPATRGFDPVWVRSDEWYSFATSPRGRGYHVLVSIDETSYQPIERLLPFMQPQNISMGSDHPLVWTHCVGSGRAFYSALGHTASSYDEPKHRQLIAGAISWAAGFEGPVCVNGSEQPEATNSNNQ